jgi:aminopeptidase-like protein
MSDLVRELIEELYPLNRSLVTHDTTRALELIQARLPGSELLEYPTGQQAWTWTIPHRWDVRRARLTCGDEVIADFDDHPLHLVSYSAPFSGELGFEELAPHLHTRPDRPDAIPFVFRYYEPDWGFCLPHARYEQLDRNASYQVEIDTELVPDTFKILEYRLDGASPETFLVVANVCHPYQVNDSITGAAVAASLARELSSRTLRHSYRFLFLPETIGSIVYLARNEELIPTFAGGVISEFLGSHGELNLQRSRTRETRIDQAALLALAELGLPYRDVDLGDIPTNDEKVFNEPDVDVPMVALNRWPFPEYHTSDDNPSLISYDRVDEARRLLLRLLEIVDADFVPERRFRGLLALAPYGLHYDSQRQNRMLRALDGSTSVVEIAGRCGYPFAEVSAFVSGLLEHGLVSPKPEDRGRG